VSAATSRPDPDELIAWRGVVIDRRTAALLCVVEQELGYTLSIIKAHEMGGAGSVSSTTHNGLGVVDLAPYDAKNKLRALKKFMGAYHRTPSQGPWSEHIHACSFVTRGMDPLAVAQLVDFDKLLDGLAGHRPDPDPWRHPDAQKFNYDAYWHDLLLEQRVTGLKARLKKVAEHMSMLRAKRRMLKAQIAAARDKQTYLH